MQMYEDWIVETSMTIESNIEVISAIREFYEGLISEKHFPLKDSNQAVISNFSKQLKNAMYDLRMQGSRAKLLIQQASGRKALVSNPSIYLALENDVLTFRLVLDFTTLARPNCGSHGETHSQHSKCGYFGPKGGNRNENYHCCNAGISTCDFRVGKGLLANL
jgi:hypothetical protein